MFQQPVIIIGAPRSGTSLLQKIIREHPDFISVPRESDMVWFDYTHPKLNDWESEGLDTKKLTQEDCKRIRATFSKLAVSASSWSKFSSLGIMSNPVLAPMARAAYPAAKLVFKTLRSIKPASKNQSNKRLVDKSVHMGLWIDVVEKVFPNALYIHITRSPEICIDSISDGWRDEKRFQTFKLPDNLKVADIKSNYWKFHLPETWKDYLEKPIPEIAAFQWYSIQNKIIEYREIIGHRYHQIKLEDLTQKPDESLQKLSSFLKLDFDPYFSKLAEDLPKVNSRPKSSSELTPKSLSEYSSHDMLFETSQKLGYNLDE